MLGDLEDFVGGFRGWVSFPIVVAHRFGHGEVEVRLGVARLIFLNYSIEYFSHLFHSHGRVCRG